MFLYNNQTPLRFFLQYRSNTDSKNHVMSFLFQLFILWKFWLNVFFKFIHMSDLLLGPKNKEIKNFQRQIGISFNTTNCIYKTAYSKLCVLYFPFHFIQLICYNYFQLKWLSCIQ